MLAIIIRGQMVFEGFQMAHFKMIFFIFSLIVSNKLYHVNIIVKFEGIIIIY